MVTLLTSWLSHSPNLRWFSCYSCLCLLCLYSSEQNTITYSEIWSHHRIFTSSMPIRLSLREIPIKSHSEYVPNQSGLHPHFHRLCWAGHLPSRKRHLVSLLVPCECLTFWTPFMPRIVFQVLLIFSSDHLPSHLCSFILTLSPYNSWDDLFWNMRDPFLHQDMLKLMTNYVSKPASLPCFCHSLLLRAFAGALTTTSCYLSAPLI